MNSLLARLAFITVLGACGDDDESSPVLDASLAGDGSRTAESNRGSVVLSVGGQALRLESWQSSLSSGVTGDLLQIAASDNSGSTINITVVLTTDKVGDYEFVVPQEQGKNGLTLTRGGETFVPKSGKATVSTFADGSLKGRVSAIVKVVDGTLEASVEGTFEGNVGGGIQSGTTDAGAGIID
jgi:hypothetical protein